MAGAPWMGPSDPAEGDSDAPTGKKSATC